MGVSKTLANVEYVIILANYPTLLLNNVTLPMKYCAQIV